MGKRSDGTAEDKTDDLRVGARTQRVFGLQFTMPWYEYDALKKMPRPEGECFAAFIGKLVCEASAQGFAVDRDRAHMDGKGMAKQTAEGKPNGKSVNNYTKHEKAAMERLSAINPGVKLGLILAQFVRQKWPWLDVTPAEREAELRPKSRRGQSRRDYLEENDPLFHLR